MTTHWEVGSQDPSVTCPEQSRCHWPLKVTTHAQWCVGRSNPVRNLRLISADRTLTAPVFVVPLTRKISIGSLLTPVACGCQRPGVRPGPASHNLTGFGSSGGPDGGTEENAGRRRERSPPCVCLPRRLRCLWGRGACGAASTLVRVAIGTPRGAVSPGHLGGPGLAYARCTRPCSHPPPHAAPAQPASMGSRE